MILKLFIVFIQGDIMFLYILSIMSLRLLNTL